MLGLLWAPAMASLSERAEVRGMDVAFAFALGNLAWGVGTATGGSGGGALAEATADAVPYLVLAVLALITAAFLRPAAEADADGTMTNGGEGADKSRSPRTTMDQVRIPGRIQHGSSGADPASTVRVALVAAMASGSRSAAGHAMR